MSDNLPKWLDLTEGEHTPRDPLKYEGRDRRRPMEARDHNDDSDGAWVGGAIFLAIIALVLIASLVSGR